MTLENAQSGFEQALQLRILRGRNQYVLQRSINLLVVRDLIFGIRSVEFPSPVALARSTNTPSRRKKLADAAE